MQVSTVVIQLRESVKFREETEGKVEIGSVLSKRRKFLIVTVLTQMGLLDPIRG